MLFTFQGVPSKNISYQLLGDVPKNLKIIEKINENSHKKKHSPENIK